MADTSRADFNVRKFMGVVVGLSYVGLLGWMAYTHTLDPQSLIAGVGPLAGLAFRDIFSGGSSE